MRRQQSKGIFYYSTPKMDVATAAHATTTGFFWLINPVASVNRIAIRRIKVKSILSTGVSMPTVPVITFQRVTFTGVSTDASSTLPIKRDVRDAAAAGKVIDDPAGLTLATVDANAVFFSTLPPTLAESTAVGVAAVGQSVDEWQPLDLEEEIILAPGEGIVCRQVGNGSAGDTRDFVVDVMTQEFTNG